MKSVKTIQIGDQTFVMPGDLSTKDIQQLVGFLALLQPVDSHWMYKALPSGSDQLHFVRDDLALVRIGTKTVVTEAEAKAMKDEDRRQFDERKAAEAAAAAA